VFVSVLWNHKKTSDDGHIVCFLKEDEAHKLFGIRVKTQKTFIRWGCVAGELMLYANRMN
jgi:hypothetical protein